MHCADICLSATHNESARKLVMTQFEPCQYRHKSRYASVLQNRCFYTYIWLAYLVRFFERLLRQTTPKLLPLFECLPLLFLLMSLRYSERPNILGYSNIAGYFDPQTTSGGAFSASTRWTYSITREAGNSGGIVNIDASGSNPLYGASNTVQPKGIFVQCLIRYT